MDGCLCYLFLLVAVSVSSLVGPKYDQKSSIYQMVQLINVIKDIKEFG